ncbi:MAG: PCRF domain-containing protein [bacterium]|nr:PCRF domain-containing protein [bacterium]
MEDLETLQKEYDSIIQALANPEVISDSQKTKELSRRLAEISKMTAALSKEAVGQNREKSGSAVLEIRAGTGGEEAAIFAAELFRMYKKYAEKQGWRFNIIDSNQTALGGYKEVIVEISDGEAYEKLHYESGVHRVQRIPETEKSGRVHTSTASVAVLLQPKDIAITIDPKDLEIGFFRSSGPGGQNVNKVETAVRITHKPTGLVVACQSDRSQSKNKEKALNLLQAKISEEERRTQSESVTKERRKQIGSAERAEKIRTYNFPQDRVTEHRIGKSWHHIEKIMEGEIDQIINALMENKTDSTQIRNF